MIFTFLRLYFSISFWTHLQPPGRGKNLTFLVSSTKLDVNATTWDCSDGLSACFFFFFFFSIFQQHSLPQCIVSICVKKKRPWELWFVFKRLRCWNWQCYSKCPNSLSSQVILFSSLPGLQNLSHKIIYTYSFLFIILIMFYTPKW